jgi:hypothetical protein
MKGVQRIRRDERGSALVLALAFLSVFGVWIASTLTFSESATKVSLSVRSQRGASYSADGGVEQAIQAVRYNGEGAEGHTSCGTPATSTATLNGQTLYVSCFGQPGSGVAVSGGSSPTLGIITLATDPEVGYQQGSNAIVKLDGGMYAHSSISFSGSSCPGPSCSQLNVCPDNGRVAVGNIATPSGHGNPKTRFTRTSGATFVTGPQGDVGGTITGGGLPAGTTIFSVVDANTVELSSSPANATGVSVTFREFPLYQSLCSPPAGSKGKLTVLGACNTALIVAATTNCPNWPTPDPIGDDPQYLPAASTFTSTFGADDMPPCTSTNQLVTFSPGKYTSAAALTALTDGSSKKCKAPLLYFPPGTYYFEFGDANPTWTISDTNTTVVGGLKTWGTNPPSNPSAVPIPGMCTGDDVTDHLGVQFIFGGNSRVNVTSGRMELCAPRAGTAQQIAVFGVDDRTATGDLHAPTPTGCIRTSPYTPTAGPHCAVIRTSGSNTTFVVRGTVYAPAAAVDLALPNSSYQVISRGIIARVLALTVNPNGFSGSVIRSPGLGSVTYADRKVLFTACTQNVSPCPASSTKLRAMVVFHDLDPANTVTMGYTSTIQSWSVVR